MIDINKNFDVSMCEYGKYLVVLGMDIMDAKLNVRREIDWSAMRRLAWIWYPKNKGKEMYGTE